MRRHPLIGERICEPLASVREFAPIVRHHHERWDGAGYPDGLRGRGDPDRRAHRRPRRCLRRDDPRPAVPAGAPRRGRVDGAQRRGRPPVRPGARRALRAASSSRRASPRRRERLRFGSSRRSRASRPDMTLDGRPDHRAGRRLLRRLRVALGDYRRLREPVGLRRHRRRSLAVSRVFAVLDGRAARPGSRPRAGVARPRASSPSPSSRCGSSAHFRPMPRWLLPRAVVAVLFGHRRRSWWSPGSRRHRAGADPGAGLRHRAVAYFLVLEWSSAVGFALAARGGPARPAPGCSRRAVATALLGAGALLIIARRARRPGSGGPDAVERRSSASWRCSRRSATSRRSRRRRLSAGSASRPSPTTSSATSTRCRRARAVDEHLALLARISPSRSALGPRRSRCTMQGGPPAGSPSAMAGRRVGVPLDPRALAPGDLPARWRLLNLPPGDGLNDGSATSSCSSRAAPCSSPTIWSCPAADLAPGASWRPSARRSWPSARG